MVPERPRSTGYGGVRPSHVHMNFVANHPDAMFLTQGRHGLQLLATPDFPRWVVRAAQQQQGILWLRQRRLQAVHIAAPPIILQDQWHRGNPPPVSGDGVIERIVGRGVDHDAVAFFRPLADGFRHHIDNRRSVDHRLRIDVAVKAAGVPVGNRPEKRLVAPAAVAEHPWASRWLTASRIQGAVAKSISEIVNGSRSAAPNRSAT